MRNKKIVKLLSLVIAVVISIGSVSIGVNASSGDVDFDDMEDFVGAEMEFTAKDANIFKRVIAGELEFSKDSELFKYFDVNSDKILNAKDANVIKRIIAGSTII